MLREQYAGEIEALLARYADRRSAVLPVLYIAQDYYGYLTPDAINEVAALLDLPPTDVYEVVGFYTLFYNRPVGTWMVQVCDDVPCCYLGAEELLDVLKRTLGVGEDQVTSDGMFTVQRVKCLAACDRAPVVQANLDYIYDVTPDKADALLRDLRLRAEEAKQRGASGRFAEDFEFARESKMRLIGRDDPYRSHWDAPAMGVSFAQSSEAEKFVAAKAESVPVEPARAAAEAKIARESPLKSGPQGVPADRMPNPAYAGESGTTPTHQAQREGPAETTTSAAVAASMSPASPVDVGASAGATQPAAADAQPPTEEKKKPPIRSPL